MEHLYNVCENRKCKCLDGQAKTKINNLKVECSVGFAYIRKLIIYYLLFRKYYNI